MKIQTMLKSIFGTAFIALLLFMVPCDAAGNPSALVGRWVGVFGSDEGTVIEFLSDGTGVLTKDSGGLAIKWKTEKDRFYITVSDAASASGYKLQGSVLTFNEDNGKINEYAKCNKDCKTAEEEYAKAKTAAIKTKKDKLLKAGQAFTDKRDGKIYGIVKIGEQTWMAENLNYNAEGSSCYERKEGNCQEYGRLYNWATAKYACPEGWHLPSDTEWQTLVDFAGGEKVAGKKLKAKNGWNGEKGKSGNGEDKFGFAALPGGYGQPGGFFYYVRYDGYWWSASESSAGYAYNRELDRYDGVSRQNSVNSVSYSVRCVKTDKDAEAKTTAIKAKKEKLLKAGQAFTDKRDGNIYEIVKIGEQTWMAENLNYNAEGSKCYDNSESNCQKYGRLYNWATAKLACPEGWHLPSDWDWNVLITSVGGEKTAGKYLKGKNGWNKSGNGEDKFGFAALPGGAGIPVDFYKFDHVGDVGYWWSASKNGVNAYYRYMDYRNENVDRSFISNAFLLSVRCVQDSPPTVTPVTYGGETYETVVIGTQTWFKRNLNYAAEGSKCNDNNESNCQKYGRLYNWNTAKTTCPKGWHLPSDTEWNDLAASVGGEETAGKYLKAKSGWNDNRGKSGNGEDKFGFSALPGGRGLSDGSFDDVGHISYWWSASEYDSDYAELWCMGLNESAGSAHLSKGLLFSVRCVKD